MRLQFALRALFFNIPCWHATGGINESQTHLTVWKIEAKYYFEEKGPYRNQIGNLWSKLYNISSLILINVSHHGHVWRITKLAVIYTYSIFAHAFGLWNS